MLLLLSSVYITAVCMYFANKNIAVVTIVHCFFTFGAFQIQQRWWSSLQLKRQELVWYHLTYCNCQVITEFHMCSQTTNCETNFRAFSLLRSSDDPGCHNLLPVTFTFLWDI
jgi:hypothetical protein